MNRLAILAVSAVVAALVYALSGGVDIASGDDHIAEFGDNFDVLCYDSHDPNADPVTIKPIVMTSISDYFAVDLRSGIYQVHIFRWDDPEIDDESKYNFFRLIPDGQGFAITKIYVDNNGFHDSEHAEGSLATGYDLSVTTAGMHHFYLTPLATEWAYTVVIRHWANYLHSHDCAGVPGAVSPRSE